MDYNIARDGQQLGVMPESQIRANLINGTFQPTDVAWREGMVDWKPLSELFPGMVGGATPPGIPQQSYMPAQAVDAPKASGLSIASLVCGILSFVTCGLTGLPGIICGHMALSRTRKSNGAIGGKGIAIAGLVTSYFGFLIIGIAIMASLAVPTFVKIQEKGLQTKSMSNARQLVMACRSYGADHSGSYPAELGELVKSGAISDEKILRDPLLHDESQIGYEYFGAGMKDSDPPDKVLLMSKSQDSRGKKVVARNDGSVRVEPPPVGR